MTNRKIRNRPRRRQGVLRGVEPLEPRLLLAGDVEFRSFDGTGNNLDHNDWGAANTPLQRLTTVEYGPGMTNGFPNLATRVDSTGQTINPRSVSNLLFDQDDSHLNDRGLTSFIFQWGQFLDHDLDLTGSAMPPTFIGFTVPDDGTETELPLGTMIPMLRSRFVWDEGVAQQINQITSYIDGSSVYGSDDARAANLRAGYGGFLLTSDGVNNQSDGEGHLLPFNFQVEGNYLPNASPPRTGTGVPLDRDDLFVAGDVRSNEQPGLTALHTLFVLEHNYQARQIAEQLGLDQNDLAETEVDELVYQLARATVGAEIQAITYNEFLPALLGPQQLESYGGYDSQVNAAIANIFSTSLYRVGHTMLPNELLLLNEDGTPVPDQVVMGASIAAGQVALGEAFFNPGLITEVGIEPYFMGLATQQIEEVDPLMTDGVRNMLFAPPAAMDLGATNLQRGRDHGLPDYNQARIDFGLEPRNNFEEISSDPHIVAALKAAYDAAHDGHGGYDAINNIDVFAAAISEDHIPGGSVGQLIHTVLVDQFARLRDGDRFYYEKTFRGSALAEIQNTRLSDIIRRNTNLQAVQDEVFRGQHVFSFRGEEGHGGIHLTLRVRGDQLQVVRGQSNQILATANLDETDIVVIYGTSENDRLRVDHSVAAAFAGSVEVHGGGGVDRLIVQSTRQEAGEMIGSSEIRVGPLSVVAGNTEQIGILSTAPTGPPWFARGLNLSWAAADALAEDHLSPHAMHRSLTTHFPPARMLSSSTGHLEIPEVPLSPAEETRPDPKALAVRAGGRLSRWDLFATGQEEPVAGVKAADDYFQGLGTDGISRSPFGRKR
ncbi:MAG: LEPR-XLL domain-containing protein [Planctomycetales bacterium]|nr:LEPR-XLL domain-containing protein [Planctomycetales bacterium]NIN77646.1 LEPR-XLL domain-containing protein [Planctomycetales bacterium]NIO34809.1 LEPR-XLL domain-containing protein [Planctomycetales bacterium]NIP69686.1 LEPR-XLL domain-containing protein [Planctomycetales bacterium]